MNPVIVNFKNDSGYEIIVNFSNVLYVQPAYSGGYRIWFINGHELQLSWQEHERFIKGLQTVLE